jgi:DNA-binding SARP family transcriptional activator
MWGRLLGLSLAGIDDREYKQDVGRDPLGGAGVSAQLELHLAGVFGVVRDGVRLADGSLRSRKARTLLKLLAVERARLVSVDRITEVLWDGDPPAAPAQHVATLVSRLRRILGSEVIRGGRQGYQLAGSQAIVIDLDEAARLISHAERELGMAPAVAGAAAERAVEILSPGTALSEEPDAAWAEPARGELRGLLRRARHALAEAAQATGDADLAARVAADAIADDPFDEGAHRLFMSACAAAGERAKALESYARLSSRLAEELGTDPAPETHDVYLTILRQRRPGDPGGRVPGQARARPGTRPGDPGPERGPLRAPWLKLGIAGAGRPRS